ncbi:MAG TPA: hypothetical protein VLD55_05715 [Candidatus Sulfobium mesophilum]|nr:hypothetical protein [Candidatus Sulfobium mesophilum]
MAVILSKLIAVLVTVTMLGAMMLLMMGVGWASGKVIRKILGIGGNPNGHTTFGDDISADLRR